MERHVLWGLLSVEMFGLCSILFLHLDALIWFGVFVQICVFMTTG